MRSIVKTLKLKEIRFTFLLCAAFTIAIISSAGVVLAINSAILSNMRAQQVAKEFEIVAASARSMLFYQIVSADTVLDTLALGLPIMATDEATGIAFARILGELRKDAPAVDAVYVALSDGSFTLARKITALGSDGIPISRGQSAVFEVRRGASQGGERREVLTYLNDQYGIVGHAGPIETSYDPRVRPWYKLAAGTDAAIITPPYPFQDDEGNGITIGRRSNENKSTIFGIDLTLEELSKALKSNLSTPEQQVVVFESDGSVIGSSAKLDNNRSPVNLMAKQDSSGDSGIIRIKKIYEAYIRRNEKHTVSIDSGEDVIIADISPFWFNNKEFVIASCIPIDIVQGSIVRWAWISLVSQVLIVLAVCLLAWRAAQSISGPILKLALDVEGIIRFKFSESSNTESRIWEIQRLAASVKTLEISLRGFSTYLPASFVHGIVSAGTLPELGGSKRDVIVLFSDIVDFTTLSESLPPDVLMQQMSRYLEELSSEIISAGGIVDKFIGDSVMAFWVVDKDDPMAARHACMAVLNAARRVDELNAGFVRDGLLPMRTRFGMHLGEAMVGSIGTPQRMNYTVLGHTVNVASRVEALNKKYATNILVTETMELICSLWFDMRPVDETVVRGTSHPIKIFELGPVVA